MIRNIRCYSRIIRSSTWFLFISISKSFVNIRI
nr:MAG TPA: hypothetical protein [Caudoviricetes sp.]